MKAKNLLTSILLLLFTTLSVTAFATAKQERNVSSFSKISVGSAFKVYLKQGVTQSVVVEIDKQYIDDVVTTVQNNTLTIKLKDSKQESRNITVMNVYITTPTISGIDASGAAKIQVETPINSNETVSFDLNGAATLKDAAVNCKKIKIEQSGASKCSLTVKADDIDIDLSGASNLKVNGSVKLLKVDASGAAKVDVQNLSYTSSNIDVSAAAKVKK